MFAAHRRFDLSSGEAWTSFIEWSGFRHISEVVSTDEMLCPNLIDQLIDADWDHNFHEEHKILLFRDLGYLKRRVNFDPTRHNLLKLVERPSEPAITEQGFEFCGYDIMDSFDSVSVLTNCGGFPDIFSVTEVNRFALLDDFERAWQITNAIRAAEPEDPHCSDCRVWAFFRVD
jgi:hypothetical protein